jgi:transcriptional regulator with XRE-family HTH domain
MHSTITEAAAKELGRSLRFIRQARSLTLRDVSRGAELSPQYIAQVELAQKVGVSEEALRRLAKPLGIPESVIEDLLLRARVQSALEVRGLSADQVKFVWRGVEQRLSEAGVDMKTDISKVVVDILG